MVNARREADFEKFSKFGRLAGGFFCPPRAGYDSGSDGPESRGIGSEYDLEVTFIDYIPFDGNKCLRESAVALFIHESLTIRVDLQLLGSYPLCCGALGRQIHESQVRLRRIMNMRGSPQ